MSRWISIIVVAALWILSGCGNDAPQCTPGESAQCFCADGTGAQTCQSDGTFSACECGSGGDNNTTPNNTPTNSTPNNTPTNSTPNNTPTNSTPNNTPVNSTPNNTSSNNMTTNNTNGELRYCKQTCNAPSDCAVFGDAANWECNNDGTCDLKACTTDPGCVRQMSNFKPGCNSSGQCGIGFTCVTWEGENVCAFEPIAGFFECGELQLDQVMATSVDNGQPKAICAAPDALCETTSGNCYRPCASDQDCRPEGASNGLVCMANGQCGCMDSTHCTISGDVCVEGECGCSSQQVCDAISSMAMVQFVCAP